jgi:hypothetical protein
MTSAAKYFEIILWKRYFVDIKQRSVTQFYSVRRSLLKYSSAAGKRFYSSAGQRNTLAQVLMNSVRRSLSVKYNSAAGNRFYSSGGQRNTLAQVSMYDSVRRSLFKYSSAAGKRFYSFGGQRNTLAQPMKLNETAAGGIITRSRG